METPGHFSSLYFSSLPLTLSGLDDLPCPDHQDRYEGEEGAQDLDQVGQVLAHTMLHSVSSNLA